MQRIINEYSEDLLSKYGHHYLVLVSPWLSSDNIKERYIQVLLEDMFETEAKTWISSWCACYIIDNKEKTIGIDIGCLGNLRSEDFLEIIKHIRKNQEEWLKLADEKPVIETVGNFRMLFLAEEGGV